MAAKKFDPAAVLQNWESCNDFLRDASEEDAKALLAAEQKGKCRIQYVLRIHGRFNTQRAKRERAELLANKAK